MPDIKTNIHWHSQVQGLLSTLYFGNEGANVDSKLYNAYTAKVHRKLNKRDRRAAYLILC